MYHTLDTVMEDPHLEDVGFFQHIDHPTEGRIVNMALPNKVSTGDRKTFIPAPKIGQQSVEILRELGYSGEDIDALIAAGVTLDGALAQNAKNEASPE
jgi:crotonobetainyl-CoA:carnitine CoA-transferase CaiB-like acyl-CoA transferase